MWNFSYEKTLNKIRPLNYFIQRPSDLLIRHLVFNGNRYEEAARLGATDFPFD